jgi:hypothetical protein
VRKYGEYDKRHFKRRNKIKVRFGKLQNWRCIDTRTTDAQKYFLRNSPSLYASPTGYASLI